MQPNENFLIVLENQNCQPISGQDRGERREDREESREKRKERRE
jgi:hypothetical protein